jgi:TRAP-type mannitol/chloroaromatic compound transport system permease large subunit
MAGVFIGAAFTDVTYRRSSRRFSTGWTRRPAGDPFFLLVGELMSSANVVSRITNLSLALVGTFAAASRGRDRLQHVLLRNVGSTTADVAVISRALGGPMKKEATARVHAAIIASASTIAALVPPSITAVVYGAVGNVSIAGLFMAGGAGFMIGFGLMIYCYFFGPAACAPRARRSATSRTRSRTRRCADDPDHSSRRHPHRLVPRPTEAGVVVAADLDPGSWVIPSLNPAPSEEAALRFLPRGIDLLAAADHDRRRQRLRLAARLSARRDRNRRMDHRIAGNDPHLIMLMMVLLSRSSATSSSRCRRSSSSCRW